MLRRRMRCYSADWLPLLVSNAAARQAQLTLVEVAAAAASDMMLNGAWQASENITSSTWAMNPYSTPMPPAPSKHRRVKVSRINRRRVALALGAHQQLSRRRYERSMLPRLATHRGTRR